MVCSSIFFSNYLSVTIYILSIFCVISETDIVSTMGELRQVEGHTLATLNAIQGNKLYIKTTGNKLCISKTTVNNC